MFVNREKEQKGMGALGDAEDGGTYSVCGDSAVPSLQLAPGAEWYSSDLMRATAAGK